MSLRLQEGIYYRAKPPIGSSFCALSLRAENDSRIEDIGMTINEIWDRLTHLKKGITVDLDIDSRHRKIGNLTVLLAYRLKFFELPGLKKTIPLSFSDSWNFRPPTPNGGGPIVEGSGINYSPLYL